MAENIKELLKEYKGKKLLAVFPHDDDLSFVAGGLMQILSKFKINTKLVCLGRSLNESEFERSKKLLGLDEVVYLNFENSQLAKNSDKWSKLLRSEIFRNKPDIVLSFAPDGITGNPDHIVSSVEVLKCMKDPELRNIKLLWRISDEQEFMHYNGNRLRYVLYKPYYHYDLNLGESINKLKAIFTFKTKFRKKMFRLRFLEWVLFDHRELYHEVDPRKHNYQLNVKTN